MEVSTTRQSSWTCVSSSSPVQLDSTEDLLTWLAVEYPASHIQQQQQERTGQIQSGTMPLQLSMQFSRSVFLRMSHGKPSKRSPKELLGMGYNCKAITISAADMGADHIRKRYWLYAHADNEGKLHAASMQKWPACRKFVKVFGRPVHRTMDDGLAYRSQRFAAIGNGQVPQVAAAAFRILTNHS